MTSRAMIVAVPGDDERALEAALQAAWDDETAAVYADLLTARGDLRGELIAIDLALAQATTQELLDRKQELATAWLGDRIPDWKWRPRNIEHGLLCGYGVSTSETMEIDSYLHQLFEVAGPCIRDLGMYGSSATIVQGIEAIAQRPAPALPWLRDLTIHRIDDDRPIAQAAWAALVEATPYLRELTLLGEGVAVSPIHPAVHTLRLVGPAIAIGRASIPSVTELGLTFSESRHRGVRTGTSAQLAGLVNPRTFPALRRLDLSSNRRSHYGTSSTPLVTTFLESLDHLDMLAVVRVPPVEDAGSAALLIDLLDRHPRLRIEIACMHVDLGVTHPRLNVPTPYAWPQTMHSREALTINFPGPSCDELALSSVIDDLEGQFEAMSPAAQQAWIAFWAFVDDLPPEDAKDRDREFPAATLLLALGALEGNARGDNIASALRAARLSADATVIISRYWGW